VIQELSAQFDIKELCYYAGVSRSGFYKWKSRLNNPSNRTKSFISNLVLFKEYHERYPSHGYRWLNAKILLDTGLIMSDSYAHKCCKTLGIASKVRKRRYRKPGERYRTYPNLVLSEMNISGPMQCIVSDMTAFYSEGRYYELTLYLDLWNNEILAHSLSAKRGDRMTYINGLKHILELKSVGPSMHTILHTDQGTVYASKEFNELLPLYNIERSMSRAGTPTDNGTMEAINGWVKAELFNDFHITGNADVKAEIDRYIVFFNEERPAYALDYLTPKQYRELFAA